MTVVISKPHKGTCSCQCSTGNDEESTFRYDVRWKENA